MTDGEASPPADDQPTPAAEPKAPEPTPAAEPKAPELTPAEPATAASEPGPAPSLAAPSLPAADRGDRPEALLVPPEDVLADEVSVGIPLVLDQLEDGWALDTSEAENAKPPAPPPEAPPISLPDPKAAAIEAARIVGEIVGDIESAGGAAIVAAAAAGAAIEAARARSRAIADNPDVVITTTPAAQDSAATAESAAPGTESATTVKQQRDRILRALAEDIAAQTEAQASAAAGTESPLVEPTPRVHERASGRGFPRAASAPLIDPTAGADEPIEDEFDPVQIAAEAIGRLRHRARTDLAELRTHYERHDLAVLIVAFLIIVAAGGLHRSLVTPPTIRFAERGLMFEHSQAWLKPERLRPPPPRLMHERPAQPSKAPTHYAVEFTSSIDPNARLEVFIDAKPAWSNIVTGLELDRRTRWGELYTLDDSSVRSIAGHDWLRTAYRYAHTIDKGDVPRVDRAVEYATIDREQIYVVTLFGGPDELEEIEEVLAPTLRVPTQTGLPLVPQTRSLAQRTYPDSVSRAFDSTVMVVMADLVDGRLKARGGGSGVVVSGDGSILTNYHVIHDRDGRLHDVFVIGRFSKPDHAPQLWCAGRPTRSKLQRELDLALIKCDLDLDGRTWNPASSRAWATLPEGRTADVQVGQRLWVLGYPDVGGGGLTLSEGEVEGWTGEDGAAGKDFIKTDASITRGNSGGPVVDDRGRLVGIASAFRTRTTVSGGLIETSQVGLVRPLSTASACLAVATVGWTPRDGLNDCDLQPSAVEAPSEGVRISTRVLDAASELPVGQALVMVLRPGVDASQIDVNRLDDLVLAWGRSNTQGEVQLKQPVPVPGTYTVMVVARGYEALIGEGELHLGPNTPAAFDPWGKIWLRSR